MALIRNIAGTEPEPLGVGLVTSTGQYTDPTAGLYSQLLRTVGGSIPIAGDVIKAVEAGINLLPAGGLKKWLSIAINPVAFAQAIITAIKGRTYTTGQYRLGERYIDQVLSPNGNPNTILSYRDVTDETVPAAITFFTVVFGVRITTDEDLWALDSGAAAYRARPGVDYKGMGDIPDSALQRAVFLKQTYYPSSTYNTTTWDLDYFSQFPLVDPIPDPFTFGKYYTGPLPGGGNATDGVIVVNTETPLSSVAPQPKPATTEDNKNLLWIVGGGLVALAAWLYYKKSKKRSVYGY